ncbi:hypothetical protein [Psittacicella hinzii]|uniref:Uncharacterized protein n=1 Tax=Psittacicella hinzii TaxID=2028575 RepID=A0A3A1YI98_9GAMM|nr:hypothetical protein [Psittacicella hinzii]RIY37882.1 hypothetical protein CKF58_04560 [Psittacicella hinzii]
MLKFIKPLSLVLVALTAVNLNSAYADSTNTDSALLSALIGNNSNLELTTKQISEQEYKKLIAQSSIHPNCTMFMTRMRESLNENLSLAQENITKKTQTEFISIYNQLNQSIARTPVMQQEFACYIFNRKLDLANASDDGDTDLTVPDNLEEDSAQ